MPVLLTGGDDGEHKAFCPKTEYPQGDQWLKWSREG